MSKFSPKFKKKYHEEVIEIGDEILSCKDINTEDGLVVANGYPISSSPDVIQNEKEETDGLFITSSPRRYSSDLLGSGGVYRTQSFDPNLFDIRQVSSEKIAEQLTLIDLALLKSIRLEEFQNCCWTKKDKLNFAPNIVKFSQRFNHTSFWVVRDILNEENARLRAEIIGQFIRIGRRLFELNNLHSLVAVVLAIQSTPIHRLTNTWKHVSRRDRSIFDKLSEFVSEEENYCRLREHMHKIDMPCIPHLGMYQKDLVYLDTLSKYPNANDEDRLRHSKEVEKIIQFIHQCQNSRYDDLMPRKHIQNYLNSVRYIDELQKFYEDDNFQLSLQREPNVSIRKGSHLVISTRPPPYPNSLRSSKSHEDLLTPLKPEITGPTLLIPDGLVTPPRRPLSGGFSESDITRTSSEFKVPSLPGPRISSSNPTVRTTNPKGSTLPANFQPSMEEMKKLGSKSVEGTKITENIPLLKVKSASPAGGGKKRLGHSKSNSVGTNVLTVLGIGKLQSHSRGGSPDLPLHPISLLDDSILDDTFLSSTTTGGITTPEYFTPPISVASSSSADVHSFDEEAEVFLKDSIELDENISITTLEEAEVIRDGILKRRVLIKNGKSTQLKFAHNYWVQLTAKSIILLPSKYKETRKQPKSKKLKGTVLLGCRVKYRDTSLKDTQFIIIDDRGNQTKYTANSSEEANDWVKDIRTAIEKEEIKLRRREEEQPLIKF